MSSLLCVSLFLSLIEPTIDYVSTTDMHMQILKAPNLSRRCYESLVMKGFSASINVSGVTALVL
jgi:hypothetical protein